MEILNTDLRHIEDNYCYLIKQLKQTIDRNGRTYELVEEIARNGLKSPYSELGDEEDGSAMYDLDMATRIKLWSLLADIERNNIVLAKEFSSLQTRYHNMVTKMSYISDFKADDEDEELVDVDNL